MTLPYLTTCKLKQLLWLVVGMLFLSYAGDVRAQESYKIRKVVIDAGHGGKDPGCNGHHSKEKEVVLSIALELEKKFKANYPGIKVILTRDKDVFVPLHERAAIANRNKADLFISIHCNYIGVRNRATGSETYVMGLHRANDNLEVAKRENAAILHEENYEKTYEGFDPNSPEGHIILSMFQNAYLEQSILFATHVEDSFKKLTPLNSRGVKQAGFLVLRETAMPSVLIETGFLSTDKDENFLMQKENQIVMADAILKAFETYRREVEEPARQEAITATNPANDKEQKGDSVYSGPQAPASPDALDIAYRIQIASSSKPNIDARFKAIEDLEVIKEGEMYKFLVGYFSSAEAARPRLAALKANGFEMAFIVAYKGKNRIRA